MSGDLPKWLFVLLGALENNQHFKNTYSIYQFTMDSAFSSDAKPK